LKQLSKYLLPITLFLVGCGEHEPVKQSDPKEYFPLAVGNFYIYAVERTTHSEVVPKVVTDSYELKTEIIDSFDNQDNGITYVIHRSRRQSENDAWEFVDTWSARSTPYQAVVSEGNTAYIRLTFPVYKNKLWNGNALNVMPDDYYTIEASGTAFTAGDHFFSDCVVVNQEKYLDALLKDDRTEVYARHVGLIYKKSIVLNYCDTEGCLGQQVIKNGVEYYQVLKAYGQY
jgi:hypothetical protein